MFQLERYAILKRVLFEHPIMLLTSVDNTFTLDFFIIISIYFFFLVEFLLSS